MCTVLRIVDNTFRSFISLSSIRVNSFTYNLLKIYSFFITIYPLSCSCIFVQKFLNITSKDTFSHLIIWMTRYMLSLLSRMNFGFKTIYYFKLTCTLSSTTRSSSNHFIPSLTHRKTYVTGRFFSDSYHLSTWYSSNFSDG
jgi:hypothetical protein